MTISTPGYTIGGRLWHEDRELSAVWVQHHLNIRPVRESWYPPHAWPAVQQYTKTLDALLDSGI